MSIWDSKVHWTATFTQVCEFCGKEFSYVDKRESTGSSTVSADRAMHLAIVDRDNRQRMMLGGRYEESYHECPHCGYLQSWMVRERKNFFAGLIFAGFFVLSIFMPVISHFIFHFSDPLAVFSAIPPFAASIILTIYYYATYNPNKKRMQNVPGYNAKKRLGKKRPTINFQNY
jgi:hypothetical protein